MEVLEAVQRDTLGSLREEWDDLLVRSPRATIYQSWEWNDAWWGCFGGRKRLRLLQIRENGRLFGIAPLYVSRHFNTPLRRLAFIGTGVTDYIDILADGKHEQDVA